jgi:hypothetical protein
MNLTGEYRRRCEEQLAQLRAALKPLEAGEMHLGERHGAGPWADITPRRIEELKKTIAIYEAILAPDSDGSR